MRRPTQADSQAIEAAAGTIDRFAPPLVTAKLALYQVMRRRGISQAQLAARLGCDLRQIRRLLDLDHPSKVEQIETVLRALGKRLVLDVRSAA